MADNPGILIDGQFNFVRPGTVLPTFVPPVTGYHPDIDSERLGKGGESESLIAPRTSRKSAQSRSGDNKGILIQGWYDLFWKNRVHILAIPETDLQTVDTTLDEFNAGNVVTAVQRQFEIYNAGQSVSRARQLSTFAFDPSGEGVTILSGTVVPYTLGGNQSEIYTYRIEAAGTPNVDTDLNFTWDIGSLLTHHVTASRVLAATLRPSQRVKEDWGWLTDIITAKSGREQRNAMRPLPQQVLQYVSQSRSTAVASEVRTVASDHTGTAYSRSLFQIKFSNRVFLSSTPSLNR